MSIDTIIEKAKTSPVEAGTDLVIGLMSYDPTDPFRLGYSLGSALISAQHLLGLTGEQTALVAQKVTDPLVEAAHALSASVIASELRDNGPRQLLFTLRMRLMTFGYGPK